jgi:hypothetical protein
MHEINAEAIFRGVSMLSKTFQKWETEKAGRQPFNPGQLAVFIEVATEMAAALKQAELLISHKHADGLVGALKQATPLSNGDVALEGMPLQFAYHHLQRLLSAIEDEAGLRLFVSVQSNAANLYAPENPGFGNDVAQKFSSIVYEIDEAGKCLALDRSTAAAFHAIRSLEAGIRALSRCLKIPDPTKAHERSWAKLLKSLKDEIDARWPTNTDRMSGDGEFFDNAYAALAAMQNPWRNATMHLDQKYTQEEAQHIYDTVRGFMARVASRMDEDGQPLA